MALPQQTTPQDPSIAPYNFVPLPERVFVHPEAEQVLAGLHDRYCPDRHTGWIDLTLTTETPMYTRCAFETPMYTRCAFDPDLAGTNVVSSPEKQQFFHHGDPEHPFIPGSSIRGMIRTLVEIMGYGKVQWTKDRVLFFRSMEGGKLTGEYLSFFIDPDPNADDGINGKHRGYKPKVCAGIFLNYSIEPCEMARVEQSLIVSSLAQSLLNGGGPGATPNWGLQYKDVIVTLEPSPRWHFHQAKYKPNGQLIHPDMYLWYRKVISLKLGNKPKTGEKSGKLVITGGVGSRKHMEFVFIPQAGSIPIDQEIVKRLEDKDQLTGWQEDAFKKDAPLAGCREVNGALRDGEPVFYLTDANGKITRIGRAQMFRLAYDHSTDEFVPDALRQPEILDLAEAIFGTVSVENEIRRILKGRVFFEDARCVPSSSFLGGGHDGRRVPEILSSPKPTSFQHYLVQENERKDNLKHYNNPDTVIRGHKLYWHKKETGNDSVQDQNARLKTNGSGVEQRRGNNWINSTQHTVIRPVRKDVQFKSRIHFENLSKLELGALLAALQLPASMRHKMGMGKPLGLGSVKLRAKLHLSDRTKRYTGFAASGEKPEPCVAKIEKNAREEFEKAIITHEGGSVPTFWEIPRMQALIALMEWDKAPSRDQTRYIGIDGDTNGRQWRDRKVLPTPEGVIAPTKKKRRGGKHVSQGKRVAADMQSTSEKPAGYRVGKQVPATVVVNDGRKVTVELEDGTRVSFNQPAYPHKKGMKVKLKIKSLDVSGNIKNLMP